MALFIDMEDSSPHAYKRTDDTVYDKRVRTRVQFLVDSTPGRLARALDIISAQGLNCTRIESQPEDDGN